MPTKRQDRQIKRSNCSIGWLSAIFLCALALTGVGRGQAVSILDSFDVTHGAVPTALIQGSDGNFYGTTATGTATGFGSVYRVTPAGVVTILHKFGDGTVASDGAIPTAGVIQASDGNYYGTTSGGGLSLQGTVFMITPQGALTILHRFGDGSVNHDGANPHSSLVQGPDGNLYGTTTQGGSAGMGTVFEMTLQGAVTILHSFGDGSIVKDGVAPMVGLVEDGAGKFYGTTSGGGANSAGTVFTLDAQKQLSILYSFGPPAAYCFSSGSASSIAKGPGGSSPNSRLILGLDGNLYGTTAGSSYGYGTIYKITPQGEETVLHYFGDGTVPNDGRGLGVISEGAESVLAQASDGSFYGTTGGGGSAGRGALFVMTPTGQVAILHSFGDPSVVNDGIFPLAGVVQGTDGNLYGTTGLGGSVGLNFGTVSAKTEGITSTTDGGILVGPTSNLNGTINLGTGTLTLSGASTYLGGTPPPPLGATLMITGASNLFNNASPYNLGTIFKVVPTVPAITSSLILSAVLGQEMTCPITATHSPTSFAATGLPDGLSLDPATGIISGSPVAGGISNVTLTATNASGSNSATLVITVLSPPVITSVLSEFGSTSAAFGYQIEATGAQIRFAATGLPTGLSLNAATGLISGTPTATGTFPVTLSATNVAGTDTQTLTLVITALAPTLGQEYVQIHSFNDGSVNGEGDFPGALMPGPSSTFYGVTAQGGTNSSGTIFSLSAQGSGQVLSALGGVNGSAPQGLVRGVDGTLYGTTQNNGSAGKGTIFKVTPDGTLTLLHTFGDGTVTNDGATPQAGLILGGDGNFYGTTQYGGSANLGTIFMMTPAGLVTIIHSFGDGSLTNDGAQPVAALVLDTGIIYGTTLNGGSAGDGTVFAYTPGGAVSILHSFGDGSVANDGQLPHAALTFVAGSPTMLYGTTVDGGSIGKGTLFQITTSGAVTILHHFGDGSVANDGTYPIAPVTLFHSTSTGLTIFGTTPTGGSAGTGTVFALDSSHNLTILHHFGDGSVVNDGQTPLSGLCLDASGNLFGTTIAGGAGSGTMYAIVANLNPPTAPISSGTWLLSGILPQGMTFDPTTGAIGGTPTSGDPVGRYNVAITSPQAVTTAQTYTLTQTFAQWAVAKASANLVPTAPSKDGVPNLLKYLYNIDPAAPMTLADHAALPACTVDTTSVPGTPYITLTYRQNGAMTGLRVTLESSTDLQNWSPVAPADLLSQQMVTDSTTRDLVMKVGAKATGSAQQFLRLKVLAQ